MGRPEDVAAQVEITRGRPQVTRADIAALMERLGPGAAMAQWIAEATQVVETQGGEFVVAPGRRVRVTKGAISISDPKRVK